MGELKIGMLGCGLIGRSHARGLDATDRADITAVFDPDRSRAEVLAAAHSPAGHRAVADSAEAVIDTVDAVYVCTWTKQHPELVKAAVAAGRAVFCEKPLAKTLDEAIAMTEAVERAGVVNQVGLVLRHSPAFRWLRHRVNQPDAGPLMNIVFRDDQYLPTQGMYGSTWRGDVDLAGGGTLLEHSIHDLDLLEWIMGPVADVAARMGTVHGLDGIDDQTTALLVAESGAQAALVSIWHDLLTRPSQRRVEVFTRNGHFVLEGDWNGPVRWEIGESDAGPPSSGSLAGDELVRAAADIDGRGVRPDVDFVHAVLDGRPAHPDFRVALAAHRLADACYRSAADGGGPLATPPIGESPGSERS